MMAFLEKYRSQVLPALKEQLGFSNIMMVPRVKKVVVNVGTGKIMKDDKALDELREIVRRVTAQQPATRVARKAIATFKTRIGSPIGMQVTLRGARMYDFLDRLIHVALPRTRDFRGLAERAVDAYGNLTIGIKEHIIFPETTELTTRQMYGMEITVVTDAQNREEGLALLTAVGFPIRTNKP